MKFWDKLDKGIAIALIMVVVVATFVAFTPTGRWLWNTKQHVVEKIDDATNYETKKKVEDSCRAMIASYEADRLTYEQYKDSENAEHQSWAAQAKMRANRTAANYNNFVLENSYVWSGNVPGDIDSELQYLE